MTPTAADIAEYFSKGIETTILSPEQAVAWADSVIADTDKPPYEFIAIALSRSQQEIISALNEVPGERDPTKAGKWLLARLQQADIQSIEGLAEAVRKAMMICRHCELDEQIYYDFDNIDDSLYLARYDQFGTVDGCRTGFLAFLYQHATPLPTV
ncbi:hypothetical protein [Azohydromonas australica]|uniref:hypothetical protein n=1 Tax=Azohydromonas australica TaxID=364039 RepID=UPI0012EB4A74|nr:hypothetical protein [Azohydromonas australica]